MRSFTIALAVATLANVAAIAAPAITADAVTACEAKWRADQKAAKAAAPEGFRPIVAKGARQTAMAECLSAVTVAGK